MPSSCTFSIASKVLFFFSLLLFLFWLLLLYFAFFVFFCFLLIWLSNVMAGHIDSNNVNTKTYFERQMNPCCKSKKSNNDQELAQSKPKPKWGITKITNIYEPRYEKTGFLHLRKQRRR